LIDVSTREFEPPRYQDAEKKEGELNAVVAVNAGMISGGTGFPPVVMGATGGTRMLLLSAAPNPIFIDWRCGTSSGILRFFLLCVSAVQSCFENRWTYLE
jgi:hypothetical protein